MSTKNAALLANPAPAAPIAEPLRDSQAGAGGYAATALYRPEALEHLRSKHGRPARLRDVSIWLSVLFMVATAAGVLAFLMIATFARKETAEGLLQPDSGSAAILFERPATVTRVFVREGQEVRAGDPLFAVSVDQTLDDGRTMSERLNQANARQASEVQNQLAAVGVSSLAQQRAMQDRITADGAQLARLRANLGLQEERLTLDQTTLGNYATLAEQGYVSKIKLRDQQAQVLGTREALNDTQRQIDQILGDIASAQAELRRQRSDGAAATAQLRASRAALDEKRAQNDAGRAMVLVAAETGRVVTLRVGPGSPVTPNVPLATLLPRGARLQAELWVPSRAIGFVRNGDEVRLMFDAFPFERFGTVTGRVSSVSATPVDAKDLPLASENKEALYRVRVALRQQTISAYGHSWALAPGSRLRGDLILEQQSLLAWLLDPLRAVKGRAL